MSLAKNWCTLDEAEAKFGIRRELVLSWVEDGLVRCEQEKDQVVLVNVDDLELKVGEAVWK